MSRDLTTLAPGAQRQLVELQAQARDALHLGVSDSCNNSCGFCLNGRVNGKIGGARPQPPTWEETRAVLERGYHESHMREAWFTVAEPTLGPHLVDAVRYARELGYTTVGMNTNGRRLGKHQLIDRLLDAGLNRIMLSMHGHSAEIHDRMVGRRRAYEQVLVGLERFADLRDRYDVTLHMLHVLCSVTTPHIEAMYRFFLAHARPEIGDKLSYTCIKLLGSALFEGAFDEFGARYDAMVRQWLTVWGRLGRPPEMLLSEVPGCVVVAQAEPGQPIPPIDVPERRFTRGDLEQGQTTPRSNAGRPLDHIVDEVAVGYVADKNYCKHERCAGCLLDSVCPGALVEYVKRFGFDEFVPVAELPEILRPSDDASVPSLTDREGLEALTGWLIGLAPSELRRLRLTPAGADLSRGRLALTLRGPGGFSLGLLLAPRDTARPAFGRTRHLNLSYRASAEHAFISQLLRRLARRHRDTPWSAVEARWAELRAAGALTGGAPR